MKLIRMTRTMAGPAGNWHPGQTRTVEDAEADALIAADAAELIDVIAPMVTVHVDSDEIETATIDPVEETAVVTKKRKKVTAE